MARNANNRAMRRRLELTTTLLPLAALLIGSAPAQAKPREPDKLTIPAKLLPLMRVYTDGKGHFLLAADKTTGKRRSKLNGLRSRNVYFGNARKLYRVRTYTTSTRPEHLFTLADPRRRRARLTLDPKLGPVFHCDQSQTKLQLLDKEATKRFIAKATLHDLYWRRTPHLLARTPLGEYFYVDRTRLARVRGRREPIKLENLRGFKMWRGRRGRMRPVKLKDVVIDAAGQVFISKRGSLHAKIRFDRWRKIQITAAHWRGKRSKKIVKLVRVPLSVRSTWVLIHRDLGPYRGKKFGLPCDAW